MNRIIEAAQFANKAHEGQARKYTHTPYIRHPARVAGRVILLPEATEAMVCAAWLHDVIEDCGVTASELAENFGEEAARLVVDLTNTSKLDAPALNRAARKRLDHDRIAGVGVQAQTIKAIDRMDNLLEMQDAPRKFLALYLQESADLAKVLTKVPPWLFVELTNVIEGVDLMMKGKS